MCLTLIQLACSKKIITKSLSGDCSNRVSATYSGVAESAFCSSVQAHSSAVNITGYAYYKARTPTAAGLEGISADRPIRYAELVAKNSRGEIVQCGETAADGSFTLSVPTDDGEISVSVQSRALNSTHLRASVLNCPEENKPYAVTATVDPLAPSPLTLRADVTGDILGGAFNILDQLLIANQFFKTQVGTCDGNPSTQCTSVTSALPKVSAYWVPGFNPNNYFGSPSPVSFYLPGYSRMFILGGQNGNTNSTDTDHFDNSVILHEYGHFIEDVYSVTDSPGGAHSGNKPIDPRLAWSEGFGNFIQAAILNTPFYLDTFGNNSPGGTTSIIFNIPLEAPAVGCAPGITTSGCDIPDHDGEGNFREFSVSRLLWDVFDTTAEAGDTVNNAFKDLWRTMTSATGLKKPTEAFHAIGFVHEYQDRETASDWSALRETHQHGFTEEYATYVAQNVDGCNYNMQPLLSSSDDGTFATSLLLRNNDFLFYKHSGGNMNVNLSYTTDATATPAESSLDIFIYNSRARLGNANDILLWNTSYYDNNPSTPQSKTTQTKNLPAGNYLIQVMVYTGKNTSNSNLPAGCSGAPPTCVKPNDWIDPGTPLTYKVKVNGVEVCPTTRP